MRPRSRSPLRLLVPLLMIAFVVAFVVVLSSSDVNHHESTTAAPASTSTAPKTTHARSRFAHRRTYTVRTGDTLGAIAIKTGVSVPDLEDLNPGLDPESLVAGQKIKLRQ